MKVLYCDYYSILRRENLRIVFKEIKVVPFYGDKLICYGLFLKNQRHGIETYLLC